MIDRIDKFYTYPQFRDVVCLQGHDCFLRRQVERAADIYINTTAPHVYISFYDQYSVCIYTYYIYVMLTQS